MASEKEKMLAGAFYNAQDRELVRDRDYARYLLYEFNSLKPWEKEKRLSILKQLITVKGSFYVEPPFYCDYGYNIEVGDQFYANFGCVILDCNRVRMGNNVLLGPDVQIYTAGHPTEPEERLAGYEYARPVTIGNNVWIGGGTIICPGVNIGDNVTIGAGSVVTKDIMANVVAAGNPCRVIRKVDTES